MIKWMCDLLETVITFQGVPNVFHVVVFYVSYGLAFLQLLLSLFSDVAARPEFRRSDREQNPLLDKYKPVGQNLEVGRWTNASKRSLQTMCSLCDTSILT